VDVKITEIRPPREFKVGRDGRITLKDCARVALEYDEQVTFVTQDGKEYDVARKSWGYYATPSTNGRLRDFGFRTALVRSALGRHNVMLVERARQAEFDRYLRDEALTVVCWLDDDAFLARLALAGPGEATAR
jgi:hypothetical protein